MISAERLRELLHYDPLTGVFTRRVDSYQGTARAGDVASHLNGDGYLRVSVGGGRYLAHRLAWLYSTGELPPGDLDHRNGDGTDNRLANLRPVSRSENAQNVRKPHRDNRTGFLGVSPYRKGFIATIRVEGKRRTLGTFPTPELAHAAYVEGKRRLHPAATL